MSPYKRRKQRGIYEKVPGSDVWWIRFADSTGRIRREKAGIKSAARTLYEKRKTEVLQGKKLPETRKRVVSFEELAKDALAYSQAHKRDHRNDSSRMERLKTRFGKRPADSITPQDIDRFLTRGIEEEEWAPATCNRYRALLSLTYRLGIRNEKVSTNPARLAHHRLENNARVRWLSQEEERKMRKYIEEDAPQHLPEFELALNTGLRLSEMYWRSWEDVSLERRTLTVPRSKHGERRHVPLNSIAIAALAQLKAKGEGKGWVFVNERGERLTGPRYWFEDAIAETKIQNFHWHDLRHTFASRLIMGGMDLRTVQELMGHKTISMTCRYTHLAPTYQLAAVERLAEINRAIQKGDSEAPTDTRTSTVDFVAPSRQSASARQAVLM
ncbi:MAG: tyrosine-type recombinase/integrase [Acidobacteria bacterium]|nr:tyrosine-type recombinase/integrase [Acidobacteriota bacterium]